MIALKLLTMVLAALGLAALPLPALARDTCLKAPFRVADPDRASTDQAGLAALHDRVARGLAPYPSLLQTLATADLALCLSTRTDGAMAYLDVEDTRIVISRALPADLRAGVLLHELRHLWQLNHGACPSDDLAMKEYARATFALEADASAISLLVSWDMKQNGDPAVWSALSSWKTHTDIAAAFAAAMRQSGDPQHAVTAAFDQWYASSGRQHRYYVAACSDYLDRQDASHLIPRYQLIDSDFFERLCELPDGRAYPCSDQGLTPP